jgi:hypothetical protein
MLQYEPMSNPETTPKAGPRGRVAELEAQLEQRDTRIRELRADLDKANALTAKLRERSTRRGQQVAIW